jgi:hypothetical protein
VSLVTAFAPRYTIQATTRNINAEGCIVDKVQRKQSRRQRFEESQKAKNSRKRQIAKKKHPRKREHSNTASPNTSPAIFNERHRYGIITKTRNEQKRGDLL